jgi:pyridoxal phosphate enzyme (YggS family)
METIADRLAALRRRIEQACAAANRDPSEVQLLAVCKGHRADAVREAIAAGQRWFGENRVQELVPKALELKGSGARWHMIGTLQTNKVDDLLDVLGLELLHSLDRERLASELQETLAAHGRRLDVLVQVNASGEAGKHGVFTTSAPNLLQHVLQNCPSLSVRGVMAMGPLEGDTPKAFALAANVREQLRQRSGLPLPVLSLGMSDDLEAAIAAGSTLLRIGTAVFGPRPT